MERYPREERRSGYRLIIIFVVIAVGILSAAHLYYQNYKTEFRTEIEDQLTAISELKISQITQWRKERLGDGIVFKNNSVFSDLVKRYFTDNDDLDAKKRINAWMEKVFHAYKYNGIFLLDTVFFKQYSISEGNERNKALISQNSLDSLKSGKVVFEDFYRDDTKQNIFLKILVPIVDDDKRMIAIIELRINPDDYLFPMISKWPTHSKTAETLILRREGNTALFLNELKFQKNSAMNLRIPLEKTEVPAVKAVLGQVGIVEGIDYRGVEVFGYIKPVPDSPWFMVARIDKSEVYAQLKEKFGFLLFTVIALLVCAGAGIGFIWRQQKIGRAHV